MQRRPPAIWILFLSVVLVYGALSMAVVRFLSLPEAFQLPAVVTSGVGPMLILLGTLLLGNAIRHLTLRRAFGKEIYAPSTASTLVTTGPYRYVRNPLYLGASVALIGWTLALESTYLVVATALMLVHFTVVAKWEERELRARLGDPYEVYLRSTPLFFPRIRKRQGEER